MDGCQSFEGSLQITTLALMKVVETNSFYCFNVFALDSLCYLKALNNEMTDPSCMNLYLIL